MQIVQFTIQIKNETIKHVNVNIKIIVLAKKIVAGILAVAFVRCIDNFAISR